MTESYPGWENGAPPKGWVRLMAFDVGGATANAMEWAAVCPETQSLIFYDEVHIVTTNMRTVAELALSKMKPEGSAAEYNFLAKIGDYENRIALADMGRYGITFTNAVKPNKTISVHRLSCYLNPNEKRPFPSWHPSAGQLGAPLVFITPNCKHLIEEIPQQKWKNDASGTSVKDELDRSPKHDALDCALYITRLMPAPATIPIKKSASVEDPRSLQSKLYWEDVKRKQASESSTVARKPYNPNHNGGEKWLRSSLLGF